jgi:hypothetical protein
VGSTNQSFQNIIIINDVLAQYGNECPPPFHHVAAVDRVQDSCSPVTAAARLWPSRHDPRHQLRDAAAEQPGHPTSHIGQKQHKQHQQHAAAASKEHKEKEKICSCCQQGTLREVKDMQLLPASSMQW